MSNREPIFGMPPPVAAGARGPPDAALRRRCRRRRRPARLPPRLIHDYLPHACRAAADQQGVPGLRPVGGSSSNLIGQGVPMVSQAVMAQFAAAGGQLRPGQVPMGMQGFANLTPQQQQQVFLQHQQALMAATGRAPSPGGGMPGMMPAVSPAGGACMRVRLQSLCCTVQLLRPRDIGCSARLCCTVCMTDVPGACRRRAAPQPAAQSSGAAN